MMRWLVRIALLAAVSAPVATFATGRPRHRPRPPKATLAPRDPASGFYPEAIDGGVTGNLPFNNQLRKFSDPLGANGSR